MNFPDACIACVALFVAFLLGRLRENYLARVEFESLARAYLDEREELNRKFREVGVKLRDAYAESKKAFEANREAQDRHIAALRVQLFDAMTVNHPDAMVPDDDF